MQPNSMTVPTQISEYGYFGSETVSAYYYRGVYFLEGEGSGDRCNEYPTYWTFSSATASLEAHRDKTYTAGEFVWIGHDYLGEPTPRSWPSKSSYFGMIDTAGFAKRCCLYVQEYVDGYTDRTSSAAKMEFQGRTESAGIHLHKCKECGTVLKRKITWH